MRALLLVLLGLPAWAADVPEFNRKRNVPHHPASIMEDCPSPQASVVAESIREAISVGAPAYNDGDVEFCFKTYEQMALGLQKQVKGCAGIKKALLAGVADAKQWDDFADKAWAMRDAFDGVLAVLPEPNEEEEEQPARRARKVVELGPSVLRDCSPAAVARIRTTLGSAIDTCAGDCYRLYAQAASNVRKEVSGCAGIKGVLRDTAAEAKTWSDDADRASVLRDAIDAVLGALARRR